MYLLFEDVIDLFLIHFSLLLAGEADTSSELLVLALYSLSDSLTALVPQQCNHLPSGEIFDGILLEA